MPTRQATRSASGGDIRTTKRSVGSCATPHNCVRTRNATVVAETDMDFVVLGQREFVGLLDEVSGFAREMLAGVAKRLREADASRVQ